MIPKDLEEIEKESCGICSFFTDEDIHGDGWCEFHQSETNCSSWCEGQHSRQIRRRDE